MEDDLEIIGVCSPLMVPQSGPTPQLRVAGAPSPSNKKSETIDLTVDDDDVRPVKSVTKSNPPIRHHPQVRSLEVSCLEH